LNGAGGGFDFSCVQNKNQQSAFPFLAIHPRTYPPAHLSVDDDMTPVERSKGDKTDAYIYITSWMTLLAFSICLMR
jgi:hypothetical protein